MIRADVRDVNDRPDDADVIPSFRVPVSTIATIAGVAAILHFGAAIFVPLAIAVLIAFALNPLVSKLRNRGLGQMPAVLLVVTLAFVMICTFLAAVAARLVQLVQELPKFQSNIVSKLDILQSSGDQSGALGSLQRLLSTINAQVAQALPTGPAPTPPVMVNVVEHQGLVEMLQRLVFPVVGPLATVGLVAVIVVFMLLERASLRDRFIRLVGTNDLHRTTGILEDAGSRVGHYLIMQLLVNLIYAVPIGVGLWLIGVPHALLWGLLTLVLRFVPYIGPVLAAGFPLFLSVAASPGWSMLFWTAALFIVVELVTSNLIEPVLYGSRTGVSPLAIIVSAIFWAWIWGPLGLVLSTPLTVCLVVLGRHLPQFALFDILFGDQPALRPHAQFYQRLLAADVVETSYRAEEALEEMSLGEYYRHVGIPALLLAQADRDRGVLTTDQENRLAEAAATVVRDLEPFALEDGDPGGPNGTEPPDRAAPTPVNGSARSRSLDMSVVFTGGRSRLDDVAAAMLSQIVAGKGATTRVLTHADFAPSRFSAAASLTESCVVMVFLDPAPSRASLLQVRRLKRAAPQLRVGVIIWQVPDNDGGMSERVTVDKLVEATALGADFVAGDDAGLLRALQDAVLDAAPSRAEAVQQPGPALSA